MRTIKIAAAVVSVALLSVACSASTKADAGDRPELPEPATEQASPQTDNDDSHEPETNERGYIPKELGEEAGYGSDPASPSATVFVIDEVDINPPCHEYGIPNEGGETLLLHVRVATGDDKVALTALPGVLNPFSFAELTEDGVTKKSQIGMCTDPTDVLPSNYGANQKYQGTIELVVPEASGMLVLDDFNGGWEWTYPTD